MNNRHRRIWKCRRDARPPLCRSWPFGRLRYAPSGVARDGGAGPSPARSRHFPGGRGPIERCNRARDAMARHGRSASRPRRPHRQDSPGLRKSAEANLDGLEVANTTSAGEQVAQWAPGARVVKIFNTIGYNIMANPSFGSEPRPRSSTAATTPPPNRSRATSPPRSASTRSMPARFAQARVLEPFALLWISLAIGGQGRDIAFRLMRR